MQSLHANQKGGGEDASHFDQSALTLFFARSFLLVFSYFFLHYLHVTSSWQHFYARVLFRYFHLCADGKTSKSRRATFEEYPDDIDIWRIGPVRMRTALVHQLKKSFIVNNIKKSTHFSLSSSQRPWTLNRFSYSSRCVAEGLLFFKISKALTRKINTT